MTNRPPSAWDRWIALLLLAWPRRFRDRFGTDLASQYRRPDRSAARAGIFAARELVLGGVGARVDDLRARNRSGSLLAGTRLDVRQAFRSIRRRPTFAATILTTMALAAALNAAVFAIVDATLLRPLPYPRERELLSIGNTWTDFPHSSISLPEYLDFRNRSKSFRAIAVYSNSSVNLAAAGGIPERVQGTRVSASFFDVLGVAPALGRAFTDEEDRANEPVVVISHSFWVRRFGGDPHAVGRQLQSDSGSATIVGVMPPEFAFPSELVELWLPMNVVPGNQSGRGAHSRQAIARLDPNVTLPQAQDEMHGIARQLAAEYPREYPAGSGFDVNVIGLRERFVGDTRPALRMLTAAVTFVLLIACANIANLTAARMTERGRDTAMRAALGASPYRIVREAAVEGAVIGVAAGAAGFLAAAWLLGVLAAWLPGDVLRPANVLTDLRVAAFALLCTGAASTLTIAGATLRAIRRDDLGALRGTRTATDERSHRTRAALTVAQIAIAVLLIVTGGIAARSFARILATDPGVRTEDVATARISLSSARYPNAARRIAFFESLQTALEAQPGVIKAGAISMLPLTGQLNDWTFGVEGYTSPSPDVIPSEQTRLAYGDYFELFGIKLIEGRYFNAADSAESPRVAIVSEMLAKKYWPGQSPVGRRIRRWSLTSNEPWTMVVGVVGDVRHRGLAAEPEPILYYPQAQLPESSMTLAVRLTRGHKRGAKVIADAVRAIDPEQPIWSPRTMEDWRARSVAQPRFSLLLLGTFAGLAIVLSAVGIYGVMAFSVSLRSRELGIRAALGARPSSLLRQVLMHATALSATGIGIGVFAAVATGRLLGPIFHDVRVADPTVLAGVPAAVLAISLLASFVPAWRAMRADPVEAMRSE
jgi:putative ABC transport system permease protein